jgi:hypothetical protein
MAVFCVGFFGAFLLYRLKSFRSAIRQVQCFGLQRKEKWDHQGGADFPKIFYPLFDPRDASRRVTGNAARLSAKTDSTSQPMCKFPTR